MAGPTTAAPAVKAPRKGKQHQPLPTVEAAVEQLPFCVEVAGKQGRHAVAKVDLPAGSLVMVESPMVLAARTRAALHVCHRCFVPIPPPTRPKKAAKALEGSKPSGEEGESKADAVQQAEQAEEETPPAFDPCLPRYCTVCTGKNAELDARLAAVRSRLLALCKKHSLEPELLQLLLLLEVQRAGATQAVPPAAPAPEGAEALPALRCGTADLELMPSLWDRKGEAWRKMVMTATRVLHQELVALAESGAVPGYTPSSLAQLQTVAGAIPLLLQSVGPHSSSAEPGLGLFPALSLFPHSCVPNCSFMVVGQTLRVRTLVDVPAGTPLNVSYVDLYLPRGARADALRAQRALPGCHCLRCVQPIEESTDRLLEGVWCMRCRVNVLVQQPSDDKLEEAFKAQQEQEAEAAAAPAAPATAAAAAPKLAAATSAGKKGGKAAKKGAAAKQQEEQQQEEEAPAAAAANGAAEGSKPAAGEEEGQGAEGAEAASKEEDEAAKAAAEERRRRAEERAEAEKKLFWRCCGCGNLQRARGADADHPGPLDMDEQATNLFTNATIMLQMKAVSQAEGMLNYVRGGLHGRLHPYNIHCLDALEPLLQIQMRKGDALGVFNTALTLWEAQRLLLDLPGTSQLNFLLAIEDAARHKAANASSAIMKKQFERKAKAAQTEIAYLRRVLYGEQQ